MTLDEAVDEETKWSEQQNAAAEAVKSLITVKPTKKGEESDVELKTDLTLDEVKIHSVMAVLNDALEMTPKEFAKECILGKVIGKKERKALSKDRQSRSEIVAISRQPEFPSDMQGQVKKEGFMRRLFRPKEQP